MPRGLWSACLPALAAFAAAALLAGCGLGPGAARGGGVRLDVTRDFGRRPLASVRASGVRPSDTVMRLLEARRHVQTRYGGGFVQSIDGLAGDRSRRRDWFFYVNGSEASVGAADYSLSPGDVIQWDHHRWDATMHIPAIVGAYPEPFAHGFKRRRFPTRVECGDSAGAACATVRERLGAAGVTATGGQFGSVTGSDTLRIVVARWSTARQVQSLATIASGPAISGIFARFNAAGTALTLLDGAGAPARVAPPGTGLVAATSQPGGATVWVVTGIDDAAVERAARSLSAAALRDAFAVAVTPTGQLKLPVGG